jgi:hypothetical protein
MPLKKNAHSDNKFSSPLYNSFNVESCAIYEKKTNDFTSFVKISSKKNNTRCRLSSAVNTQYGGIMLQRFKGGYKIKLY